MVPKIRTRPNSNVLLPIITRATQKAYEAQNALSHVFRDIDLIWEIHNDRGLHQQYFFLHRPRLLLHWPERNPNIYFPDSDYDYSHYKYLWWDLLQKEDVLKLVKFGNVNTATARRPPTCLVEWWEAFGVNKSAINLELISSMSTLPLHRIKNMYQYGPKYGEILFNLILNHFQWVNKTKMFIQMINGQLVILCKRYTKMWNTLTYEDKFHTHI
jgi:hypothetical protein